MYFLKEITFLVVSWNKNGAALEVVSHKRRLFADGFVSPRGMGVWLASILFVVIVFKCKCLKIEDFVEIYCQQI